MSLISQWNAMSEAERPPEENKAFWDEYFGIETGIYKKILACGEDYYEDKLSVLAAEFEIECVVFSGFMDGINASLEKEYELNKLKESTSISLKVDFEKLYYNMLNAKAKWLYTLDEWEPILSEEKRKGIKDKWSKDQQAVSTKIGRNSPCPCGSGKKYKKCCGSN